MKITFANPHLSIEPFNEVQAGDFIVLTGVNGSGKSHLLEAIEQRHVRVNDSTSHRVVKFNFETFRLESESAYNAQQISAERQEAWNFFQSQVKHPAASWKPLLGPTYSQVAEKCRKEKTPLWETTDLQTDQYKSQLKSHFDHPSLRANQAAIGVYSLIQQLPYCIDEIGQDKFTSLYKPYSAKQDFLPVALGKIVWDYYIKYRNNQINEFENEKHGKSYEVLTEEEFIQAHGDKPWEVINSILRTFNTLDYSVGSPEGSDYFGNFLLKLIHTKKAGLEVDFNNLSSGERVLMALVASIYKSSSDRNFPDLLLLDELDASLHPSMMKNMLSVIQEVFLKRGVKVILVTHSPTTIALCPEESIYVMNRAGANRIEKRSRNEALSILTEGFATLEESMLLFDEVAQNHISIITEGKNTLYIKKALSIANLTQEVTVIEGVESISGKSQLKTLFDFFSRVPHQNKVLFVWDCDASYSLGIANNTFPFFFATNVSNGIARSGIENLFPEPLFAGFIKTITSSQGKIISEFDDARKRDFETHVLGSATDADFSNFAPFIARVRALLLV